MKGKFWSSLIGIIVIFGLIGTFIEDEETNDQIENQDMSSVEMENQDQSEEESDVKQTPKIEDKASDSNESVSNSVKQSHERSKPEFNRVKVTLASPVDGDTIKVHFEGNVESVRFLLVDTPETSHPRLGKQPFGEEAKAFTTNLVQQAETLELEFDIGPTRDKYQRLLAYVYADGQSLQEELLKRGLARVAYVYPPSTRYVDPYKALQNQAQQQGIGIWSVENYVQEDGYHKEYVEDETLEEQNEPKLSTPSIYTGPYDPFGSDKDCSDFDSFKEAQSFFEAAGGPTNDPHRLDGDKNGRACESLP